MNGTEINQRLLQIKETDGKNAKIAMLAQSLEDENFLWAIEMMLDPRARFYVAKKTLDAVTKDTTRSPDMNLDIFDNGARIHDILDALQWRRLSGNDAKNTLITLCATLNDDSWELLTKILLKKPDAGFTASSVNKARAETVWTFDCMLSHKFEEKRIKSWPVAVEPKLDGWRCLAVVTMDGKGGVAADTFSRTGKPYESLGSIEQALCDTIKRIQDSNETTLPAKTIILDGEIVSGSFNDTASAAGKKGQDAEDAVFYIFDVVNGNEWETGAFNKIYTERRGSLISIFGQPNEPYDPKLRVTDMWITNDYDGVQRHNSRIQSAGGEGVIVKPLNHLYERKRSYAWLKVKGFETHDLIITGIEEGEGKYMGKMGAVFCDYNGVTVRVGGGWSDADREEIWNNWSDYEGRMIEVGAHETTPDGSLRHPRFMRFRDDKHHKEAA
jgi:DNA ligase-1